MTVQQTDTLQNLTYHYDKFGNLAARKDNKRNLTETFTYDNLNRLKTTSMGGLTASMTYDNLGRMTGKQDIVDGGQAPQVRQGRPVGLIPSGVSAIAPSGQASTQAAQPMHLALLYSLCGLSDQLSGLWHHTQRSGHPLKKRVVRMPGPSWMA